MKSLKKLIVILVSLMFALAMFTACGGDDGSNEDAVAITADAAALDVGDFTFASGDDANDVTEDFTLPTSGENGGTITWSSNNTGLVSISGGSATVDNSTWTESYGFSKSVVLTATISKGTESTTKEITINVMPSATSKAAVTVDSVIFNMVLVPGGKTFPIGVADNDTVTVSNAYWIAETEVTYELWSTVYEWAANGTGGATGEGQYSFANLGVMGDGTGDTNQHPVTKVHWRDSIVWCNALTEYYNAKNETDLECVYYTDLEYTAPLRDSTNDIIDDPLVSGEEDQPYIKSSSNSNIDMSNCTANGFRLLTNNEWELAARYRGADITNTVQSTINSIDFSNPSDGIYWTKGNSASGATKEYNNANPDNGIYAVYWDGVVDSIAEVKSKASNELGLYDMTGNIWELCFEWEPSLIGGERFLRGASWRNSGDDLQVSLDNDYFPHIAHADIAFRFARTY